MALLIVVGPALAAGIDQTAKVTEAVNEVKYGPERSTEAHPAKTGTLLHDGEYVKTGKESRAELLLPSTSVTRLGANTIFNYSLATNEIDLQAGTILFCKPKDAKQQLNIKTAAVTAGIVGTTGFVQVTGQGSNKSYVFGLIEGKANAQADGKTFPIHGGQILKFTPGSAPQIFAFDIPKMVDTSPLLHGFKGHLPNQKYIDEAVNNYLDDEHRGFTQTSSVPTTNGVINIPGITIPAVDSAQNAQSHNPPPPASRYSP